METTGKASPQVVRDYSRLFVNRGAYNAPIRSTPVARQAPLLLSTEGKGKQRRGVEPYLTANNSAVTWKGEADHRPVRDYPQSDNKRSKWVAIDADYAGAMEDLLKLQYFLQQDKVEAALEMSKRGGHSWELHGAAAALFPRVPNLHLQLGVETRIANQRRWVGGRHRSLPEAR